MENINHKISREKFIGYIFGHSCEHCPIAAECRNIKAFSCTTTAKQFFRMYNDGGSIDVRKIQKFRV